MHCVGWTKRSVPIFCWQFHQFIITIISPCNHSTTHLMSKTHDKQNGKQATRRMGKAERAHLLLAISSINIIPIIQSCHNPFDEYGIIRLMNTA
jgi:hypothetical protein